MESEERVGGAASGSPSSKAKITIANEPQEAVIVFSYPPPPLLPTAETTIQAPKICLVFFSAKILHVLDSHEYSKL
jgi:hypothetical protein